LDSLADDVKSQYLLRRKLNDGCLPFKVQLCSNKHWLRASYKILNLFILKKSNIRWFSLMIKAVSTLPTYDATFKADII